MNVITITLKDNIAILTLDRAEKHNAMGNDLWRELPLALHEIAQNPEIRCLVINANGRHFSAGLDLDEANINPDGGESNQSTATKNQSLYRRIRYLQAGITELSKVAIPTIAAVHGACIGGGVDLIAACDIRLATTDATFSIREAKIAIVADLGSLQRLPSIIPKGVLFELALSGRDFTASEALQWGLVNRTTSPEDLLPTALELAEEIATNSPLATRGTKEILNSIYRRHEERDLEWVALWNTAFLQSDDLREAFQAFRERRRPQFRGC